MSTRMPEWAKPPGRQFRLGPRFGKWDFICGSIGSGRGWIRIFGVGVSWKDSKRHELIFSERTGHTRPLRIRGWLFGALARGPR